MYFELKLTPVEVGCRQLALQLESLTLRNKILLVEREPTNVIDPSSRKPIRREWPPLPDRNAGPGGRGRVFRQDPTLGESALAPEATRNCFARARFEKGRNRKGPRLNRSNRSDSDDLVHFGLERARHKVIPNRALERRGEPWPDAKLARQ